MTQGKDASGTEVKRIADPQNSNRRRAIKTIVGGITALTAYQYLPAKWEAPIIESIFIPAHAQTSGDFTKIHPLVHDHAHENTDPHTQAIVDPDTNAVLHVHTHPHNHKEGDPDYHTDIGTPDSSSGIDHSHTHSHSEPHPATCTQCGEQLLTDDIGGQPEWNSLLVRYNSIENSYQFAEVGSNMQQFVNLSETCAGITLRLNFGDGGGTGPLKVSVAVGNTAQEAIYTGGGLVLDIVVPPGPTSPAFVDIRFASLPLDLTTKIISPTWTVIC